MHCQYILSRILRVECANVSARAIGHLRSIHRTNEGINTENSEDFCGICGGLFFHSTSPAVTMATHPSTELPKMQYVNLGPTGCKVSRICLGTMTFGDPKWREWVLGEEESRPIIKRALDLGINFFDTADMYSSGVSEEVVGRALKDFAPREDVVIATKVFFPHSDKPNRGGLSRKHIMDAVELSLKRLGTDYIDLYQIHRWDNSTPIEETLEALHDLVRAGKVHYIGASSMYAWQFSKTLYTSKYRNITPFVTMQNHYNLIYREEEREMIPLCKDQNIGMLPWSPLARGYLARELKEPPTAETLQQAKLKLKEETKRSQTDNLADKRYGHQLDDYEIMWRVSQLAKQKGISPALISIAWMLHKPYVTAPIIGASKMNHLEDAVRALDVKLTPEEIAYLEAPYKPHAVSGDLS